MSDEPKEQEMGHWGDVFPGMTTYPTDDPRIFSTDWIRESKETKKTYFACLTTGSCYGVDVIRPPKKIPDNINLKCTEAFNRVKMAVYHYEDTGEWPKEKIE